MGRRQPALASPKVGTSWLWAPFDYGQACCPARSFWLESSAGRATSDEIRKRPGCHFRTPRPQEADLHRRTLGRSGIEVPPLLFGGNVFGWTVDEPASFKLLD